MEFVRELEIFLVHLVRGVDGMPVIFVVEMGRYLNSITARHMVPGVHITIVRHMAG